MLNMTLKYACVWSILVVSILPVAACGTPGLPTRAAAYPVPATTSAAAYPGPLVRTGTPLLPDPPTAVPPRRTLIKSSPEEVAKLAQADVYL
jgi:hypothetical protein